jgi:eukaryotic-like serine/threonine-protein kinase
MVKGEMLVAFPNMKNPFPRYSIADLLTNKKGARLLKGKTVLLGLCTGDNPGFDTPVHGAMSGMELTARIMDNIINNRFISSPPLMLYMEILALCILGVFAFLFFPRMGHIGRLGLMIGLSALVFISGLALLSMMHTWVSTAYIIGCLVTIYLVVTIRQLTSAEKMTKASLETNRMLGLSFQTQGLLDLALDKFKKLPLDNGTKDLIYDLGLEYERKTMPGKALEAYEYINKGGGFRDLDSRISALKESNESAAIGSTGAAPDSPAGSPEGVTGMLGRYEVLGELGKGSMGIVYKGLDPKINRLLAIKTIRFSDEFDEDVIQEIKERFFREAEIAGQLSHPSIVTIYDVGEYRDLTYMAMEFLEGDDLENFISKKSLLPFRKVLDIVMRVAEALDFAHKTEVIHRDIKPANIMLLKNGDVKVTDFGIAKAISSSRTKTGVILGTPNYMSPEQIMGQKIDQKSDIFSLGVLFYQLLTGETPFHGDNLSALLYQITQVKQQSIRSYNPKFPKVCEQIVDKALAKNPDERFKTAGDMAKFIKLLASKIDQLRNKKAIKS